MPPYQKNKSRAQQRMMFALARRGEISMADAKGRAEATDQKHLPEHVEKKASPIEQMIERAKAAALAVNQPDSSGNQAREDYCDACDKFVAGCKCPAGTDSCPACTVTPKVAASDEGFDPGAYQVAGKARQSPEDANTARLDAQRQRSYEKIWSTPREVKGQDPAHGDGAHSSLPGHPAPSPKPAPAPGKTASTGVDEGPSNLIYNGRGLLILAKFADNYGGFGGMSSPSTGVDTAGAASSNKIDGAGAPGGGIDNQAWSGNGYNSQIPPGGFGVGAAAGKADTGGFATDGKKLPSAKPAEVGSYTANK